MTSGKNLISIIFCLAIPLLGTAQTPGYVGKKWVLSASLDIFPYWNRITYREISGVYPRAFTTVIKKNFSFGYTAGRKNVLSLSYSQTTQKFVFKEEWRILDSTGRDYSDFEPISPTQYPVKMSFIELHDKLFIGNYIAPVGFYHHFKLGYAIYGLDTKDNSIRGDFSDISDGPNYIDLKADKKTYTGGRFAYGLGRTKVVYRKVFIDGSIMFTPIYFGKSLHKEKELLTVNNYVSQELGRIVRAYNRFEISFGIGLIGF